jgi:hypothetical protein
MKKFLLFFLLLHFLQQTSAQSVGINTDPHPSAVFDIWSNSKGVLFPWLNPQQRNNVVLPAKGLFVYDTTSSSFWYHTGKRWVEMAQETGKIAPVVGAQLPSVPVYNMTNTFSTSDSSAIYYDHAGPSANYSNSRFDDLWIYASQASAATRISIMSLDIDISDSLVMTDEVGHRYVFKGPMPVPEPFLMYGLVKISFRSNSSVTSAGYGFRFDKIFPPADAQYNPTQLTGWYFNPAKLSMRGGINTNNSWHPDSSGYYSFAWGKNIVVKGDGSVAMGQDSRVIWDNAIAIGGNNLVASAYGIALGNRDTVRALFATAIGEANDADGESSVALGQGNKAVGAAALAMGAGCIANGMNSVALGSGSISPGDFSIAMGVQSKSRGYASLTAGYGNETTNIFTTAIGNYNISSGENSMSLGYSSRAIGNYSIVSGNNSRATGEYSIANGNDCNSIGEKSFATGNGSITRGRMAYAAGLNLKAKQFAGFVAGSYNDSTNAADANNFNSNNRIFQVGNGTAENARSNAMTILQNGNVGIGILTPSHQLVVGKSIRIDGDDQNTGSTTNALLFGSNITGEAIASKRTGSGGLYGLDFYTDNTNRMTITNDGTIAVVNNVTVQNGKGIIRGTDGTQLKKLSAVATINTTIAGNATQSFSITWPETFSGTPECYVGNVTGGTGGWAEVVMTVANASNTGATLYVFNPRATSYSPNFTIKVIAIGPQ